MTTAILSTELEGLRLDVINQLIVIPLPRQDNVLPLVQLNIFELEILFMKAETVFTSLNDMYLLLTQRDYPLLLGLSLPSLYL